MTDSRLQVDPVCPVIGAEISGVDLSAPLTLEVFETLHAALMTHLVLFFRDQALSFAQQKAFGRRFGDLHIHPAAPKESAHPEILVVHGDDQVTFVPGELWHSDVSCDVEPPLGSILRIEQVSFSIACPSLSLLGAFGALPPRGPARIPPSTSRRSNKSLRTKFSESSTTW